MTRCKVAPPAAKLPLPPTDRQRQPERKNAGSVSRPGKEFVHDIEVVACIDFVRGQDAIFAVDFEDGDRDHQVTGELEGMGLCEFVMPMSA